VSNFDNVKVISFDVEGTLVTTDYSYSIWFEAIPEKYAEKNGLNIDQARQAVEQEYRKVGDQRLEWYNTHYWFKKLELGPPAPVMKSCENRVIYYPEVKEVLASIDKRYKLVVASGSSSDFLRYLLKDIRSHFWRVHSSITDYKQLKTSDFYTRICGEMSVDPAQVVHVGDNWQFDFVAPSQIGIKAFHLDRGQCTGGGRSLSSLMELKARLTD